MSRDSRIILIGGGGHAKVLIDLIKLSGQFEIAGILDTKLKQGSQVSGITVLGGDDLLTELYEKGVKNACIAVGSTKDNSNRKILYEKAKQCGLAVPLLIHPHAIVSKSETMISMAVQIMAGAVVQPGSAIGENTIINTGAIVEHDCKVGSHIHVCPGAVISGGCSIGEGAFIGAGATVIHGISIGRNAIIAAGSVVVSDVPDGVVVKGAPAR